MNRILKPDNIGQKLEVRGWEQGSVIKEEDFYPILNSCVPDFDINVYFVAVVTSHSCDIANNNLDDGPFIEIMVGELISELKEDKTSCRNPRVLHSALNQKTMDLNISKNVFVEFKGYKTIKIPKVNFVNFDPSSTLFLVNQELKSFVAWLAARSSRPALPTSFNNRIAQSDPKRKSRKIAKSIETVVSGIYVQIFPNEEIADDENYNVNLLALVSAEYDGDLSSTEEAIRRYAAILTAAGMGVQCAVVNEKKISVADLRRYERFFFDDLSIRNNTPLPPEIDLL